MAGNSSNSKAARRARSKANALSTQSVPSNTPQESIMPDTPSTPESNANVGGPPHDIDHDQVVLAPDVPEDVLIVGEDAVTVEPVVVMDPGATDLVDTDSDQVQQLKLQLQAFAKAVSKPGSKPEDFKMAAKLAAQFTKYVIQFPKVDVLDALLSFFKENITTVCDPRTYMKGAESLPQNEQQQVGFLHGLFSDLARGQAGRVNSALVIQTLKKVEILEYYNRKVSAAQQAAANNPGTE